MSDEAHRQLVRAYRATGDPSLLEKIIHSSLRKGDVSLLQLKEDGIPWHEVAKRLHWLNPNIPSPADVEAYRTAVSLERPEWHPDFVSGPEFFVHADPNDNWAPSWPGEMITMYISFWGWNYPPNYRGLSPRKMRKLKIDPKKKVWQPSRTEWGTAARIAFWGADDTGMERDIGFPGNQEKIEYPESIMILDDILRNLPLTVSQAWLRDHGFIFG